MREKVREVERDTHTHTHTNRLEQITRLKGKSKISRVPTRKPRKRKRDKQA